MQNAGIFAPQPRLRWRCGIRTASAAKLALILCPRGDANINKGLQRCRPFFIGGNIWYEYERTGLEAINALQAYYQYQHPIPAALLTGDTAPEQIAMIRESGIPLLHKPISSMKLRAIITSLLLLASEMPAPFA